MHWDVAWTVCNTESSRGYPYCGNDLQVLMFAPGEVWQLYKRKKFFLLLKLYKSWSIYWFLCEICRKGSLTVVFVCFSIRNLQARVLSYLLDSSLNSCTLTSSRSSSVKSLGFIRFFIFSSRISEFLSFLETASISKSTICLCSPARFLPS